MVSVLPSAKESELPLAMSSVPPLTVMVPVAACVRPLPSVVVPSATVMLPAL